MRRLVVVLLAALGFAPAAEAADPLVGLWRYGDGQVRVVHANGAYTGIVTAPIRFGACSHRAGETMWRLFGGDGRYSGRHLSFGPRAGCGWRLWLRVSLTLGADDRLRVRVARREGLLPNACGLLTDCFALQRRGARPGPPPSAQPKLAPLPVAFAAWETSLDGPPTDTAPLGEGYRSTAGSARIVLERQGERVLPAGSLLLAHTYADRTELTALQATRVLTRTPTVLRIAVAVARSEIEGCTAGATGTVTLREGEPDEIAVAVCGRSLVWRAGARVSVRPLAGA